jgi:hypothetical protein
LFRFGELLKMSRDSSVGISSGFELDDRMIGDSILGGGWEFFCSTPCPDRLWGPPKTRIQWVPRALSLGIKFLGREADHSPPSSAEAKECVELYLHSPIHLNGVALS